METYGRSLIPKNTLFLPLVHIILVWLLFPAAVTARQANGYGQEAGNPYIQNYTADDYKSHIENHAVVQDEQGVMYVANRMGVIEYDGVSWRLITVNEAAPFAFSLAVDSTNTVFVGGWGELGYLAPDLEGELHYISLVDSLPEAYRAFDEVRQTVAVRDGIYFFASQYIFRWHNQQFEVLVAQEQFETGFAVGDSVYVKQKNVGLMHVAQDRLRLIPGGGKLSGVLVATMLPQDHDTILIGSVNQGLFHYNGQSITPFTSDATAFLRENQIRHGTLLNGGTVALGTQRGGVAIVDKQGNLQQILNKTSGLRNEEVHAVYLDRQGILWLALNNGLSKVELNTPITLFTDEHGIEGSVNAVIRHRETLYAATTLGVYYLTPSSLTASNPQPARFNAIPGLNKMIWHLFSADDILLAGTNHGVYEIRGTQVTPITPAISDALFFHRSRKDPNRIYVGVYDGLIVLEYRDGQWAYAGRFTNVREEIRSIMETPSGTLWLGTVFQGLLKIEGSSLQKKGREATVQRFGEEEGFPHTYVYVYTHNDRPVFATLAGLWRFDDATQRFSSDATFGAAFADSMRAFSHVITDSTGNVWARASYNNTLEALLAKPLEDGTFQTVQTPFQRLTGIGDLWSIYPDRAGITWFGGSDGIARYDGTADHDYTQSYATRIQRVRDMAGDSLLPQSPLSPTSVAAPIAAPVAAQLPYQNNAIRIEYAALSYVAADSNRYQYKLDGFDKDWSAWTAETKKEYMNLPDGRYTFSVRARNVYDQNSAEAQFAFSILTPWYKTWWAYLLYILSGVGFVAMVVKSRVRYLEKKTAELEAVVSERTATITEQTEKLKELDRMKSDFFANISHEFRTPLTLILGPLEKRLEHTKDARDTKELTMMHRNATRVLQLINQILDLSRIDAKTIKLQVSERDLHAFVKGIAMSFASLADDKAIDFAFTTTDRFEALKRNTTFYVDHDVVEKVVSNLLSNAFKFTPEGGKIHLQLSVPTQADTGQPSPTDHVLINVNDTGPGIPAEQHTKIFERFYQTDAGMRRKHEGTGIGLSLTKELIELHHGSIRVESDNKGTAFIVCLPVGREHFTEEELAADTVNSPSRKVIPEVVASQQTIVPQQANGKIDEDATLLLIVDDHPEVRAYIRSYLDAAYEVLEAENGQQGIEIARDTIPDLIISDVMMPEIDGYALCNMLKTDERTSHIPVILLTAKAGDANKLSGLQTGADDYLTKPFNYKELQARTHNLIHQRRKLRERFVREGILTPRHAPAASMDEAFLHRLMSSVEEHLADDGFGVKELSAKMNMGVRQLHRKVKALVGRTPVEFIRHVRLQHARALLEQKAGSVSEIAFQVGFSSLSYFSKMFKEEFGKLPSEIA